MDNDWPHSPYSSGEQMRIMRDLEVSKKEAFFENDQEKLRNLKEIN